MTFVTRVTCSFCGKAHDRVRKVIAGPGGVHICDECVQLCEDILAEEGLEDPPEPSTPSGEQPTSDVALDIGAETGPETATDRAPAGPRSISDVMINAVDPEVLASFWSSLLGRAVAGRKGPYMWLERHDRDPGVGFQKVDEPGRGKNRVHLDISVSDVVAAKELIKTLGGRRADSYESGGFLVMLDPEGNEFCVVPDRAFPFDDDGTAHYLDGLQL